MDVLMFSRWRGNSRTVVDAPNLSTCFGDVVRLDLGSHYDLSLLSQCLALVRTKLEKWKTEQIVTTSIKRCQFGTGIVQEQTRHSCSPVGRHNLSLCH
ncbi:hypothetical protein DPEC_G00027460 [Dallia pectoralis]|uniref:Uncharacterized protein n=1 Tax=Dallia pectoralis TaxID=75939 RepID=A0ACC2HIJ6_DALPE|nr:hypothetical protein DPEC_G00027460 [Dallia pectoralis]